MTGEIDKKDRNQYNSKSNLKNLKVPSAQVRFWMSYHFLIQTRNRPQRENRKKPSHFGFNYCHQCRRTESIDDLMKCKKEDCPNFYCYSCIKKNKQVSDENFQTILSLLVYFQKKASDYTTPQIFPKIEF